VAPIHAKNAQIVGAVIVFQDVSHKRNNDNSFIDFLYEQLALYPIPTQAICFEMNESIVTTNWVKTVSKARAFKELGFYFGLDNFSCSMSSWEYLKNLSVDYIKINGALVKNIVDDKIYIAMVKAINEVAHVMDIQTIAKHVESKEIFEAIKVIGIDYVQGYNIAKPSPLKIW
jgi:EAL domain-containing protein (putative c-di-GMP-specific phosphodiesterase class I)